MRIALRIVFGILTLLALQGWWMMVQRGASDANVAATGWILPAIGVMATYVGSEKRRNL